MLGFGHLTSDLGCIGPSRFRTPVHFGTISGAVDVTVDVLSIPAYLHASDEELRVVLVASVAPV